MTYSVFLLLTVLVISLDSSVRSLFICLYPILALLWIIWDCTRIVTEDNTWARVDMEYLVRVFTLISHEWDINLNTSRDIPCLQATIYYFVYLLYKHTDKDVYDNFTNISDHSQEISRDFQKFVGRPLERFLTFSEDYLKGLSHG